MTRLSLRVWLVLALALVVVVPPIVGAGAWIVADGWRSGRESDRTRDAVEALRASPLDTEEERTSVAGRLARLDVEAEVVLGAPAKAAGPGFVTPGLKEVQAGARSKDELSGYRETNVVLPHAAGTLWVRPESTAAQWAIALGAGAVAGAAVLGVIVVFLRRWVLGPLATLSADADRIAGGELDVAPVPTRAREVAQVSDALCGMAGGLREALRASTAAERDRRFLVTAIAHDLRTPLFTLRGSLEALECGIGDGRYLARAQDRASDLDRLVTDLFAFSRLEYAGEKLALEDVDVAALARRAAEAVDPLAAARGCALELRTAGAIVRGDAEALSRMLTNLLDNAIRHARLRVVLATHEANGSVGIDVLDDGPGFAEDDLDHVFDPLFRSDRARTHGGSGLGLAIARRLARAHGGDVRAANDPAGGARLTVVLPASAP
jgi:signal transduction histidine kinase